MAVIFGKAVTPTILFKDVSKWRNAIASTVTKNPKRRVPWAIQTHAKPPMRTLTKLFPRRIIYLSKGVNHHFGYGITYLLPPLNAERT